MKGILLCIAMVIFMVSCHGSSSNIDGQYEATGDRTGSMSVSSSKDGVRIELRGGSMLSDGASASADCEAVAVGSLAGNVVHAQLVPFEGDLVSLDAEDIKQLGNPAISVSFTNGGAVVEGAFKHCGLRNFLDGSYKRQ